MSYGNIFLRGLLCAVEDISHLYCFQVSVVAEFGTMKSIDVVVIKVVLVIYLFVVLCLILRTIIFFDATVRAVFFFFLTRRVDT